jgi:uncharacterized Rmd1/YagE family protein
MNIRSFSSDPSTGFKQLVPPPPSAPPVKKVVTIIEPPVRSRPFRPFRAARIPPSRTPPKRVAVPDNVDNNVDYNHNEKDRSGTTYPVQAIHAAQTINLASVLSKVFATKGKGIKKMMERLSVVVQLPMGEENESARFVAVFRFGSVVFFNVAPREAAALLTQIKKHAGDPVLTGVERKEHFCVHVLNNTNNTNNNTNNNAEEQLPENPVTGEYCIVQELNMKSVDVISNVMAQSVALDAYSDMVDELLAEFATINHTVKGSGKLTTVEQGNLFKTVAQNNSIFIDMVSKLGIKDRSDTAWNLSQYEDIHSGMKEEFEINIRFKHIEFKLDLIQQNAKFFLEVLHNQKSNTLEWIIIVLIGFECVLMCMDMSGAGPVFFEAVSQIANYQQ